MRAASARPALCSVLMAAALCVRAVPLHAQLGDHVDVRRPATMAELLAGNALVGGVTAAIRALSTGHDPFRAFGMGALGGMVHLAGKNLAVEPGAPKGWLGLALAGAGTSIVSNAGRGVGPFQELSFPVASLRIRVTPREEKKVRLAINVFESAVIASSLARDGLELDWTRTVSSGAIVLVTQGKRIVSDGVEIGGIAVGPVAVISEFSIDASRTVRHEVVHVHQHWFAEEAWGRPIEGFLRSRIPVARHIPRWLELGVVVPSLRTLEYAVSGEAGLIRFVQAEAELLERR